MAARTVSTCTAETARGTHRFQVSGSSCLCTDRSIRSGTFNVGGYDWAILCHRGSDGGHREGYMSFYLQLLSRASVVRALFDLRLIDQTTGKPCSILQECEFPIVFDSTFSGGSGWGGCMFKKKNELDDSVYVRDDCFVIECEVAVVKEPRVSESKSFCEIEVPSSDLSAHFGKLLEDMEGADLAFDVEGETFAAHKFMLIARSPVFKAALRGHMREQREHKITIEDIQPAVFKALLHFIYTDSLPPMDDLDRDESTDMIRHLLVAADRYAMERLKLMCERNLSMSLDTENVADTFALADQHHCDKLKEACVEFMAPSNRMDAVLASQGYQQLKRTCPSILVDVWEKRSRVRRSWHANCSF